ncbi:DUF1796 family putative cysteine peptidase [Riemerella anatipestifer]|uniref:DUF1796 family putative cysteine peptidase n=1 Tax=Riemerella anatipestifer TaxID=34085 RepID=UPI0021F83120|nr:DUF1796 family putative cysteine peptidase [Riemerella anatipestifer]MCW0479184.1 DUF1796 family putative cysteine peptidase [Riemerella anatipestifer]MCW0497544.1 DUF1796 family putative cysteine peptidase [Riemerella anatipestifer]
MAKSASLLSPHRLGGLHRLMGSSLRELRPSSGFAKFPLGSRASRGNFAKPPSRWQQFYQNCLHNFMKISFWRGENKSRSIHIYSRFYSRENIIPIGSDCHSAYILSALNIRKQSLVFDWLYSDSRYGINYVNENIKSKFAYFLENLKLNYRNHIISEFYPETEFFHEKNLISSLDDRNKMYKRAMRFLKTISERDTTFLYVINPTHFKTIGDIDFFIETINELFSITNKNHRLKIFLKCKENELENPLNDEIIRKCNSIKNVYACKYFIDTHKFGQWGNTKDYFPLLRMLKIKIYKSFIPKIYID